MSARYRGRRARVRVKKLKDKLVRMARDEEVRKLLLWVNMSFNMSEPACI